MQTVQLPDRIWRWFNQRALERLPEGYGEFELQPHFKIIYRDRKITEIDVVKQDENGQPIIEPLR